MGILYDRAQSWLITVPRPDVPRPPLFDGRLSKNGGFMWMSEMALADLEWWARAKQKTVDEGGQYATQASKAVVTLTKWVAWRTLFPFETWSGKRGDERVSGAPPSGNPRINEWGPRSDDGKKKQGTGGPTQAPKAEAESDDPDYGF